MPKCRGMLSVQFSCSVVSDSLWPHEVQHTRPPCPSPTPGAFKLMSIESMMPSNHLILCHPLLLLPSILPSIRVFSNESALCIRRPEYWSFSFSINPSNEYSGLIFFRIDWFDLLAVQGTRKSLLQHHSLKASILWCSAFFMVQLSHPYMTTWKTIALTIPWRKKWQPTPVFLLGKSHGQNSLLGYSPWGHKESDMTEHTHAHVCMSIHMHTHEHTHAHYQ